MRVRSVARTECPRVRTLCGVVLGQISPRLAKPVRTNPNRVSGIKLAVSSLFSFALPAKLGPAVQIDAENSPIDDLEKRVKPADLFAVENHVRPGISANDCKWIVELMGVKPPDRPARILAFKGQRGTQAASITEQLERGLGHGRERSSQQKEQIEPAAQTAERTPPFRPGFSRHNSTAPAWVSQANSQAKMLACLAERFEVQAFTRGCPWTDRLLPATEPGAAAPGRAGSRCHTPALVETI